MAPKTKTLWYRWWYKLDRRLPSFSEQNEGVYEDDLALFAYMVWTFLGEVKVQFTRVPQDNNIAGLECIFIKLYFIHSADTSINAIFERFFILINNKNFSYNLFKVA